jgi:uncharacterized membrane protein
VRVLAIGVALLCIVLGVALRFSDLASRSYSNDEATTSLRVAGSSLEEWSGLFDGRARTVEELRVYQTLVPGRSTGQTIRALALEDPQHPPLYYVLQRGWISFAGRMVADRRALSAVFGTLAIGAGYLLGVELGGTFLAGVILAALIAVSPFQAIYAQQAREYSLWSLAVLLSTVLLLRAARRGTWTAWSWYAASATVGLYTDLLFVLTLAAQLVIVVALPGRKLRATLWSLAAAAAACVAFAPWLVAVVRGAKTLTNNDYLGVALPWPLFLAKWAFNASTVFVDLEYRHTAALVLVPAVALALAAFVIVLARSAASRRALVVALALAFVTTSAMLALDLVRHESRSTAGRYLIPAWVGLEILAASAMAALAASASARARRVGIASFAFFAAIGLASLVDDASSTWTWADTSVVLIRPVADAIDAAANPVVIFESDGATWDFTAAQLLNELRSDVRVVLLRPGAPLPRPPAGATAFLLDPGPAVRARARRSGYALDRVYLPDPPIDRVTATFRARARAVRRGAGIPDDRTTLWRVVTARAELRRLGNGVPWPASFRPYAADAFWNRRVPALARPRLLPNSAAIVATAEAQDRGPAVSLPEYGSGYSDGRPVVFASSDDPRVHVRCTRYCGPKTFTGEIRIPPQARPGSAGDAHLSVIQPGGEEIDFWAVQPRGWRAPEWKSGATISAGAIADCGNFYSGPGTMNSADGSQVGDGCLGGGFIHYHELLAGRIAHALITTTLCGAADGAFVYPAFQPVDNRCSGPDGVPNGAHLWLDLTDKEVSALPITAWEKTVLRAMHDYGAYVMDFGGESAAHTDTLAHLTPFEGAENYVPFGVEPPFYTWAHEQGWTPVGIRPAGADDRAAVRWTFTDHWDPLAPLGGWKSGHLHVLDPCYAKGSC